MVLKLVWAAFTCAVLGSMAEAERRASPAFWEARSPASLLTLPHPVRLLGQLQHIPTTGCFVRKTCLFFMFWRLDVWGPGASLVGSGEALAHDGSVGWVYESTDPSRALHPHGASAPRYFSVTLPPNTIAWGGEG